MCTKWGWRRGCFKGVEQDGPEEPIRIHRASFYLYSSIRGCEFGPFPLLTCTKAPEKILDSLVWLLSFRNVLHTLVCNVVCTEKKKTKILFFVHFSYIIFYCYMNFDLTLIININFPKDKKHWLIIIKTTILYQYIFFRHKPEC